MSNTAYTDYQLQQAAHIDDTAPNGNTVHTRKSLKRDRSANEQPGIHVSAGSSKTAQPNTPVYDKMPDFIPAAADQYVPHKRGEQSTVWNVFRIVYHVDHYVGGWVWCTLGGCRGWVKRGGNGTSAMQNHLKHNHSDIYANLYGRAGNTEADSDLNTSMQSNATPRLSSLNANNNSLLNNSSSSDASAQKYGADYQNDPEHPRKLIPELCRQFYTLGWVTGTGGGISIRYSPHGDAAHSTSNGTDSHTLEYYIAPSSVQKERMTPDDMYVYDAQQNQLSGPDPSKKYGPSQCTPLFYNAYLLRNAGACIHTHSQYAVLCTLLYDAEFAITHQEMIKGIKIGTTGINYRYYDNLIVPIIENTAEERDLKQRMYDVMQQYPYSNAVLVRRHGLYVWGNTWQQAKTQCECYDYLFQLTVQLKQLGIDPSQIPANSEYGAVTQQYKHYTDQAHRLQQYNTIHANLQQLQQANI